ncbi:MAG: hypothetical protein ACHQHN_11860 [Sphingobacteriales bacterium]
MKKTILVFILLIGSAHLSFAQLDAGTNTTAIGLGASSTDPNYKFTYQNNLIPHYGVGWFNDTQLNGGPMGYLGGYGGLKFFTGSQPRLYIDVMGNIGIGTTTPNAKLHVAADANTSGAPDNAQFYITGLASPGKRLSLAYNTSSNYGEIQAQAFGGSYSSLNLNPNGGNVGIGTISPGALFHVFTSAAGMNTQLAKFEYTQPGAKGSAYVTILSGTRSTDIEQNAGDGTFRYGTYMDSNIVNNYSASDGTYGNINFVTGNSGGGSVAMTIGGGTQKGNIGIGTTNPQGYKLAVNGNVIATSITVKLYANWPDYVFKKDYQLPKLSDIKTYINQNHHLPEMPTEQQIANNGLNLGDMNKLLVKKVEELTLYLIEKDEKEKAQQKIIADLNARLTKLEEKMQSTQK